MEKSSGRRRLAVLVALAALVGGLLMALLPGEPVAAMPNQIGPPANYPVPAGCTLIKDWQGFTVITQGRPLPLWYRVLFCQPPQVSPAQVGFQQWPVVNGGIHG